MNRVSPEIDQLMWSLAESENPRAIEEFEARYPMLRVELAKRIEMIHDLRVNRPSVAGSSSIPTFKMKEPVRYGPSPQLVWTAAVMGVLALVALGIAANAVLSRTSRFGAQSPYTSLVRASGGNNELNGTNSRTSHVPADPSTDGSGSPGSVNSASGPASETGGQVPSLRSQYRPENDVPSVQVAASPKWRHPQTVHLRRTPMQTVLQLVASEGGLKLEIAPGTPNPQIEADYENLNSFEILTQMGQEYAFTPLWDEADKSVLIIPAVAHAGAEDTDTAALGAIEHGAIEHGAIDQGSNERGADAGNKPSKRRLVP